MTQTPWPRTETQKIHYRKVKRDWFADNPVKRRAYNRKYWAANAERLRAEAAQKRVDKHADILAYNRQYRLDRPDCHKVWRARKKFRLAWIKWTRRLAESRHGERV